MKQPQTHEIEGELYETDPPRGVSRFMSTSLGSRVSDGEKVVIKKPVSQWAVMALRDSVKARACSLDAILPKYLTIRLPNAVFDPVVLQYLHGRTLSEASPMIRKMGDKEMIELILNMTRVLILSIGRLMDHGLLHRDIKPENALIDGRFIDIDTLVAADRRAGVETFERPLGSRIYMPPEIFRGSCIRPWSDFYSLGMTVLMTTGSEVATNFLQSMSGEDLIWLRGARIGVLRKEAELENAVQKLSAEARGEVLKLLRFVKEALKDDPDRRPKTASEYLQILEDGGNLAEV